MTHRPYTNEELRAAAALMHYALTTEPNPSDADAVLNGHPAWAHVEVGSDEEDTLRESVVELVSGAADVSEWAVNLGADGLQPDGHTLQLGSKKAGDDDSEQPFVRMHFAFHPTATDAERDRFVMELAQQTTAAPAAVSAAVAPPTQAADEIRAQLLHAIDLAYTTGVLGYTTPEDLLAAYDNSRTPATGGHTDRRDPAVLEGQATTPTDRAAVLREAADAVARLDRRKLGIAADTIRDAWEEARDEAEAELRRMADETATETPSKSCAHCGQPVRRVTGTLTAWWVHDPGGNTICDPQHAASSTRATPERVKHSGPDSKFCVLCLSGEHERADEQPAAGARQGEPPQPSLRDQHRAAWHALTPDQQTTRLAELDEPAAGARQDGAET
ncbi:hypothetical protein ACPCUF_23860 [Streptomyces griseoincarnatus]